MTLPTHSGCIVIDYYENFLMVFFFQAEDGIRDIGVTGVQTCGSSDLLLLGAHEEHGAAAMGERRCELLGLLQEGLGLQEVDDVDAAALAVDEAAHLGVPPARLRSEERRVGKECRSRWSPYH